MFKAYGEMFTHYFDFSGKSTRRQYWFPQIVNAIIYFVFIILMFVVLFKAIMGGAAYDTVDDFLSNAGGVIALMLILLVVMVIYIIATAIPFLALTVRRFRDAGVPVWSFWVTFALNMVVTIAFNTSEDATAKTIRTAVSFLVSTFVLVVSCLPSKEEKVAVSAGTEVLSGPNPVAGNGNATNYISPQYGTMQSSDKTAENPFEAGKSRYSSEMQYSKTGEYKTRESNQYGMPQNLASSKEEDEADDSFDYQNSPYMSGNGLYTTEDPNKD